MDQNWTASVLYHENPNKGFKTIPIVAVTVNAIQGDRESCIDSGMNDYMIKPVKREKVLR